MKRNLNSKNVVDPNQEKNWFSYRYIRESQFLYEYKIDLWHICDQAEKQYVDYNKYIILIYLI